MSTQILSQPIKAKVEFDFDSIAFFSIELSGPTIEDICEQIDMIENRVIAWGDKNFPESPIQRIRRFFGFQNHRERIIEKEGTRFK